MGFVSQRTSEISGQIIDDDQVIIVIVRSLDKKFDAAGEELAGLKRLTNVIQVELQHPDGREPSTVAGALTKKGQRRTTFHGKHRQTVLERDNYAQLKHCPLSEESPGSK